MSGKKKRRKGGKYAAPQKKGNPIPYIVVAVLVFGLLIAGLLCWRAGMFDRTPETSDTSSQTTTAPTTETTVPQVQIYVPEDVTIPLGEQLEIIDLGSYTGLFVEDGSDEVVSGVLMVLLANKSDKTLQYAEITLRNDEGELAYFSVSTLPAGSSAVLLEKNRKEYSSGYEAIALENVVFFEEEPSKMEEQLQIQASENALNVVNISGEDIEGDIQIYYKNSASDVYYGGITYMVKIQGGMKAGETKQLMPNHFQANSSSVMFVVIVP